jgi:putative phosphoribosyl transferase
MTLIEVESLAGRSAIAGDLVVPSGAMGLVIFAHGSGSSRHSSRNQYVAKELNRSKLATLLMDLLTPEEDAADQVTGRFRFDIALLAERLVHATDWAKTEREIADLPVGYFGASTGAAAAIIAATKRPRVVKALVSRGGRVDLAGADALHSINAPALFIVGENDPYVLKGNQDAIRGMRIPAESGQMVRAFPRPALTLQDRSTPTGWASRSSRAVCIGSPIS